jgi:predicted Rossmann fold flavoprotein
MAEENIYDVIVIGGGASGMMAAAAASARGKRVLLLEKNARLGEKLLISGGGRCNILNAEKDEKKLLAKYGKAEQFLYSPFSKFGMQETRVFFESSGLPLKVEAKLRAFPASNKSADVLATLLKHLKKGGVEIRLKSPVTQIRTKDRRITSVIAGRHEYSAHSYILATGGLSRPETGSTGDGFGWLRELGHTVAKPTPTIAPLLAKEKWVRSIAGLSASVKILFTLDAKRAFTAEGPILFTHKGISGPTILNSSGKVAALLEAGDVAAHVDFFPALNLGEMDAKLTALFDAAKNKTVKNTLRELVPLGLALVFLEQGAIDPDTKVHSVSRDERKALGRLLKDLPLSISGLAGFEKAVVADGGVSLSDIDTKTMRSKKIGNLFVTGDLLHIVRPSGGYSLQLCWTTGFVAGSNA